MPTPLDPLVSEFANQEDADSYNIWFRAKVESALHRADDPTTPRHTTDAVLRRMDAVIKATEIKLSKIGTTAP